VTETTPFTPELWPGGLPYGPPGVEEISVRDPGEPDGWTPIDMSTVFDGNFQRPKATLGRRTDGVPLLYPGREHVVSAEPESAKTWFICYIAADVLNCGGRVLYLDFEDDEGTIGMRIHWMGANVKTLCDLGKFRYLRPDSPITPDRYIQLLNFGTDDDPIGPTLVVLDGTTEGYGLHGWDIADNNDSPKWRNTYVKPALKAGAATLGSDHVVKNREARGGYAIGAQHKKAGLTGVLYELQVEQPFGLGKRGRARLLINKDRNGDLRRHGIDEGKATYFADLVLDATAGEMESPRLWLYPAASEADNASGDVEMDPVVQRSLLVEQVLRLRGPLSAKDLRDAVPGRATDTDKAVQSMLNLGTLHEGVMVKGPAKLRHLPGQCAEGMACFRAGPRLAKAA
jgi:hypothetical protein